MDKLSLTKNFELNYKGNRLTPAARTKLKAVPSAENMVG
jgi:hypothetical protein